VRLTSLVFVVVILLGASLLVVNVTPAAQANSATTSGFITSWDGAKIHYIEAGRSKIPAENAEAGNPTATKGDLSVSGPHQSPSILFVPGFTMPAWIWENQIAHFSTNYHVVAMDLRSQGDSSKTGEGAYPAAHARDIKAVVERLHLAPVVIVGWSMGVTIIASYVDQFGTSRVAGIVLVDGIAGLDLTPEAVNSNIEFLKRMESNRSQMTADFVRSMFRKPHAEEYLQKLIKGSMATPTDSAVAMGLAGFTTDNRPALAKINKPTLLVGATERLLPQFQDMQKSIPGAKLEFFDDAGHTLFVDDADKFNISLDKFLTTLN
jgi:non-heme chloroperoxidase